MVDLTFITFLLPYSKMSAKTLDCYFIDIYWFIIVRLCDFRQYCRNTPGCHDHIVGGDFLEGNNCAINLNIPIMDKYLFGYSPQTRENQG